MVKDGRCVVTTSLQDVTNSFRSENTLLDPIIKKSILNNNYSVKLDAAKLIKGLANEVTDADDKKMVNYLQDNISNITFESAIKDDIIQATGILNIKGKHKNSFEYFFNVIENLLEISDPGK